MLISPVALAGLETSKGCTELDLKVTDSLTFKPLSIGLQKCVQLSLRAHLCPSGFTNFGPAVDVTMSLYELKSPYCLQPKLTDLPALSVPKSHHPDVLLQISAVPMLADNTVSFHKQHVETAKPIRKIPQKAKAVIVLNKFKTPLIGVVVTEGQ